MSYDILIITLFIITLKCTTVGRDPYFLRRDFTIILDTWRKIFLVRRKGKWGINYDVKNSSKKKLTVDFYFLSKCTRNRET